MRAVIFEEFGGPLSVRQVPDPTPRADGVVIAVKSTGICRSDWHGWRGHDPDIRVPHVPGHELAGEVVAVGRDVGGLRVGARVTVPFVSGCGGCSPCQRGDPQVCDVQFQPGFTALSGQATGYGKPFASWRQSEWSLISGPHAPNSSFGICIRSRCSSPVADSRGRRVAARTIESIIPNQQSSFSSTPL